MSDGWEDVASADDGWETVAEEGFFAGVKRKIGNVGRAAMDNPLQILPGVVESFAGGIAQMGVAAGAGARGLAEGVAGMTQPSGLGWKPEQKGFFKGFQEGLNRVAGAAADLPLESETEVGKALDKVLMLVPEGITILGDTVFEKTGSALAGAGTQGIATLLTLQPQLVTKVVKPLFKKDSAAGKQFTEAFDQTIEDEPWNARQLAEQVDDEALRAELHARIDELVVSKKQVKEIFDKAKKEGQRNEVDQIFDRAKLNRRPEEPVEEAVIQPAKDAGPELKEGEVIIRGPDGDRVETVDLGEEIRRIEEHLKAGQQEEALTATKAAIHNAEAIRNAEAPYTELASGREIWKVPGRQEGTAISEAFKRATTDNQRAAIKLKAAFEEAPTQPTIMEQALRQAGLTPEPQVFRSIRQPAKPEPDAQGRIEPSGNIEGIDLLKTVEEVRQFSNAGTLSGGLAPKALVDTLGAMWTQSPKFVKDWAANTADALGIIADPKTPTPNRMAAWGNSLVRSAEGEIRSLGKGYGAPVGYNKLADWLFERPGMARSEVPAFEPERRRIYNIRMSQVEEALKGVRPADLPDVIKAVREGAPDLKTPVGRAAARIEVALNEHAEYLVKHGALDPKKRVGKNYFPRQLELEKVLDKPEGFLKSAERAFIADGVPPADAKLAAKEWLDKLRMGDLGMREGTLDFRTTPTSSTTAALLDRALGPKAEKVLSDAGWYISDPRRALSNYLWKTGTVAETKRILGPRGENWERLKAEIIREGGGEGLRDATNIASRVLGTAQDRPGIFTKGVQGTAKLLTPLMLLSKATLTSIPDMAMPAIRAGKPHLVLKSFSDAIGVIARTKSGAEKAQFARFVGATQNAIDAAIYGARVSLDYTPGKAGTDRTLSRYFQLNFLHQLTEASRAVAVDFSRAFLGDHALHVMKGDSQARSSALFLSELVPPSKVPEFARWVAAVEDGKISPERFAANPEMAQIYARALTRFADQAVMLPTRAERPAWASTPQGAIFYELSSFTQSFFKNVIGRAGRLTAEAAKGNMKARDKLALMSPVIALGLLPIIQYAQYELRDKLFPTGKEKTEGEKVARAIQGTGILGQFDKVANAFTATHYAGGYAGAATLAGPFYGSMVNVLKNLFNLGEEVREGSAGKTNTAERNVARSFYDVAVEPGAALLATTMPGGGLKTLASAGAIQAAGHPMVREKFVTSTVGPDTKRQREKDINELYAAYKAGDGPEYTRRLLKMRQDYKMTPEQVARLRKDLKYEPSIRKFRNLQTKTQIERLRKMNAETRAAHLPHASERARKAIAREAQNGD